MVDEQLRPRGVEAQAVLAAMAKVPRHRFVPPPYTRLAYEDRPLPIGHSQTISQPFIVAYMSEAARITPGAKVLEIGTGSGYQAAVLAEMGAEVYTVEIVPELAKRAERTLEELGYRSVRVRSGDGYQGWPQHAPFDAIVVTAAPERIPQPLIDQLAVNGRLIVPVGTQTEDQRMTVLTRTPGGIVEQKTFPVRFVPLTREKPQEH
uniref:Protein-L-isoaspartate O-methyltransferase n=2 Tax=Gloeobacter violaceus TaxID=33072 RepID=PIMT_GLOVI|nr:RecName: Full=Protein-L-isoaspartate O-methyltransferase; AltName: Full=L-isoaspartyl protein carboxyl methyltransferase; AltName: Full=Protein L-isoaspartyl methyltransferase; AltName: Full=Protein-beta-aspartate methyltransferase; Short=PIMT [Gloeobacter violaceus PCC 7421]